MRGSPTCAYEAGGNTILLSVLSPMRRPMLNFVLKYRRKWAAAGLFLAVPLIVAPILTVPSDGLAAESLRCLSGDEQRAAGANGKTVPLATVIHALHRAPKDVIKAQLCQEADRLIYRLTLLGRDGKVKRATVDANSGSVVGER
jgi:hypothetical protein